MPLKHVVVEHTPRESSSGDTSKDGTSHLKNMDSEDTLHFERRLTLFDGGYYTFRMRTDVPFFLFQSIPAQEATPKPSYPLPYWMMSDLKLPTSGSGSEQNVNSAAIDPLSASPSSQIEGVRSCAVCFTDREVNEIKEH